MYIKVTTPVQLNRTCLGPWHGVDGFGKNP